MLVHRQIRTHTLPHDNSNLSQWTGPDFFDLVLRLTGPFGCLIRNPVKIQDFPLIRGESLPPRHDNLRPILTPREHRTPRKSFNGVNSIRTKSENASHVINLFSNSCHRTSTNFHGKWCTFIFVRKYLLSKIRRTFWYVLERGVSFHSLTYLPHASVSFVLTGDYIEYSSPIINCLKSW